LAVWNVKNAIINKLFWSVLLLIFDFLKKNQKLEATRSVPFFAADTVY
jgi:hypothetical protein